MDKCFYLYAFQKALAIVRAGLTGLLGEYDGLMAALLWFMAMGYAASLMCVISKLPEKMDRQGICQKMMVFLLIGMGHTLDTHLASDGNKLRTSVILFYIVIEGLLLLKKADDLGVPIPAPLKAFLEWLYKWINNNTNSP